MDRDHPLRQQHALPRRPRSVVHLTKRFLRAPCHRPPAHAERPARQRRRPAPYARLPRASVQRERLSRQASLVRHLDRPYLTRVHPPQGYRTKHQRRPQCPIRGIGSCEPFCEATIDRLPAMQRSFCLGDLNFTCCKAARATDQFDPTLREGLRTLPNFAAHLIADTTKITKPQSRTKPHGVMTSYANSDGAAPRTHGA